MKRWQRRTALCALALGGWLLACNACGGPLRIEPLGVVAAPLVVDTRLELARSYAPWIYHAIHPTRGRQDIPTRVDFDGDLRGDNNWDNLPRYELPPTVYYAVLETKSHYFISYHLFHPRDYSYLRVGLHEEHENDGENLQVVVDKRSRRVVLLYTQAHYKGGVYAAPDAGFGSGARRIRGPLLVVDDEGRPAAGGRHAGVFVEWGGHGIYGVTDSCSDATVGSDGAVRWRGAGIVLRPARPGEAVREPEARHGVVAAYQLESTARKLWPGLKSGKLLGRGGLFDGALPYADARVRIGVPRFYEGDRFSGPLGPDRGISPFALDFDFCEGTLGALFFDPAARYASQLQVPRGWSREYIDFPY